MPGDILFLKSTHEIVDAEGLTGRSRTWRNTSPLLTAWHWEKR